MSFDAFRADCEYETDGYCALKDNGICDVNSCPLDEAFQEFEIQYEKDEAEHAKQSHAEHKGDKTREKKLWK